MGMRASSDHHSTRKGFGPGRSILRQAFGARGRKLHNIWYHYSPRLGRDVVLRSDLAFDHFCWIEADSRVHAYELDLDALPLVLDQQVENHVFDVRVQYRNAPPELHEFDGGSRAAALDPVKSEKLALAVAKTGYRLMRITAGTLAPHVQLIRNWRCALAFQASCRDMLLAPYQTELQQRVREKRQCTLEQLLLGTNPDLHTQYLAALFTTLQHGLLTSDLDLNPLCLFSRIRLPEVDHA